MQVLKTLILVLLAFQLSAQNQKPLSPCGTKHDVKAEKWLDAFLAGNIQTKKIEGEIWVPVTTHLISNSAGERPFNEGNVLEAMCQLNLNFLETGIQFYHAGFKYVNSNKYYDHDYPAGTEMMTKYNVSGTVNTYFVANPAENCGYFSPAGRAVAIGYNCAGPEDDTWAHELGHYLSLPHTFSGWEGTDYQEGDVAPTNINGKKVEYTGEDPECETAADRFCDTPADYLSFRWSCNGNDVSSMTLLDPDSVSFNSDGTFFMSYANSECMNRFSSMQMDAMIANLQDTKPGQIDPDFFKTEIELDDTQLIYPLDDEIITSETFTLEWAENGNATGYLVEISRFKNFTVNIVSEYVEATSLEIEGLEDEKRFYWRLTPFNNSDFCAGKTDEQKFETEYIPVSVNDLEENEWKIFPNPSSGNFQIKNNNDWTGEILLRNLQGQTISRKIVENQNVISFENIEHKGVYILCFVNEDKRFTKKVIVQ